MGNSLIKFVEKIKTQILCGPWKDKRLVVLMNSALYRVI